LNLATILFLIALVLGGVSARAIADSRLAAPSADQAGVGLLVYKKWIGASGDEANAEIRLSCGGQSAYDPRFINTDRPDGWRLEHVPPDGVFCTVQEVGRDTFIADAEDCRDLLVVPGRDVECTVVNTKIVKRIDMLNRYGIGLMIAVMLTAGLAAVRKFT